MKQLAASVAVLRISLSAAVDRSASFVHLIGAITASTRGSALRLTLASTACHMDGFTPGLTPGITSKLTLDLTSQSTEHLTSQLTALFTTKLVNRKET